MTEEAALQGVGAAEMSNGEQPVIGISTKYQDAGVYTVEVRSVVQSSASPYCMMSSFYHLQSLPCSFSITDSELIKHVKVWKGSLYRPSARASARKAESCAEVCQWMI